jgi:hypothetical protein
MRQFDRRVRQRRLLHPVRMNFGSRVFNCRCQTACHPDLGRRNSGVRQGIEA